MKIFAYLSWFYATVVIFLSLTIVIFTYYLLPRPYARKLSVWFVRVFIYLPLEKKGTEDKDAQMFLVNHQSDIDIAVLELSSFRDLAWVAKQSLFNVPFFGLALRIQKDIAVQRDSKTALIKLIKDSKDRLDNKRTIVMFPEGTRSSGKKMLPFKSGAKIVADKHKLCVQPIVLIQTAKYYNIKKFYYKPGTITMIYMDSFIADRSDKDWLKDLREKMQKVYDDELANNPSHR